MTLTRTGGFLILLGSIADLVGFLFLPFSMDPMVIRMTNGPRLMGRYLEIWQNLFSYPPDGPNLRGYQVAAGISYGSTWAIIVVGVLLAVFAIILLVRGRSSVGLPLTCLLLGLIALVCLFLVLANWGTNGANLFSMMFPRGSFPGSIIGIGWWIGMSGALLAVVGSILSLRGSRSKRATLESRWTA